MVLTNDGSATLYNEMFDENYHSVSCGALQESYEKHIKPVFSFKDKFGDKITILDVCFGLGYNAFGAILLAEKHNICLDIISPEIDENIFARLKILEYPIELKPILPILKELESNGEASYKNSHIKLVFGDLRKTLPLVDKKFDAIFQDPFSPKKNSALWSVEYFSQIYAKLNDFAVLTTYSQASSIRLSMYEAGFNVYDLSLQKPIRSGTIASNLQLIGYKQINLEHKKVANKNLKPIYDNY